MMQTDSMSVDEIVSVLSTWDAEQVERFAESLPYLGEGCRTAVALNDDYVLKIAPDGYVGSRDECTCYDYICDGHDNSAERDGCYEYHDADEIMCECETEEDDYWRGQNLAEAQMWNQIRNDAEAQRLFVSVIASDPDGKWLIAERVTQVDWSEFQDAPAAFLEDVQAYGIKDVKSENVGRRKDGSWVMLDYGISTVWEESNGTFYN
jgi:hypothetical protein